MAMRGSIWIGLAVLGAAAIAFAPPPEGASAPVVQPAARHTAAASNAPAATGATRAAARTRDGALTVLRIAPRRDEPDGPADADRLWLLPQPETPPAPPVVAAPPPPPPPPTAPPLPYQLLGRYAEEGRMGVMMIGPDGGIVVAHVGEKLGNDYRIESITGNTMVVIYLPMKLAQTLDIGIAR